MLVISEIVMAQHLASPPSRACMCERASRPRAAGPGPGLGYRLRTSPQRHKRFFINESLIHFLSHHKSKPAPFFVRLCGGSVSYPAQPLVGDNLFGMRRARPGMSPYTSEKTRQ